MTQKKEYRKDYNLITRENFDDFLECYLKNGCHTGNTLEELNINTNSFTLFLTNNPDLKEIYRSQKTKLNTNKFKQLNDVMFENALKTKDTAISIYMHKYLVERGYDTEPENEDKKSIVFKLFSPKE
jgi:hypothetical protein